jgi:DNA-directed RNA polymerase specialized sigma24 family protein
VNEGACWRSFRDYDIRKLFPLFLEKGGIMDQVSLNEHLSRIPTCWNVLKQAHGGSSQKREVARAWFVERYEPMVRRYLAKAVGTEAAAELTQEFAIRFLEGRYSHVDMERGRFRDYLKTCLFALVSDFRKKEAKSIVKQMPAEGFDPADNRAVTDADDKSWKLSWRGELINRSLQNLQQEERREHHFLYTVLKFRMDHPDLHSPEAAEKLSGQIGNRISAGWFRKRLMAGRERFATYLLETVAESVENPTLDAVKDELADLELLSYCGPLLDRLQN